MFIRTYKNPTYNFNEVNEVKVDSEEHVEEHKYFKVSEATDISEKMVALVLGVKSGHDCEYNKNGTASAATSRASPHVEDGRVVDVTSVVVLPEFRKNSVGATLFKDYIQRLATVRVADCIRVHVPAGDSVVEFFERLDFKRHSDNETKDGFVVLENNIEEDDNEIEHDS